MFSMLRRNFEKSCKSVDVVCPDTMPWYDILAIYFIQKMRSEDRPSIIAAQLCVKMICYMIVSLVELVMVVSFWIITMYASAFMYGVLGDVDNKKPLYFSLVAFLLLWMTQKYVTKYVNNLRPIVEQERKKSNDQHYVFYFDDILQFIFIRVSVGVLILLALAALDTWPLATVTVLVIVALLHRIPSMPAVFYRPRVYFAERAYLRS